MKIITLGLFLFLATTGTFDQTETKDEARLQRTAQTIDTLYSPLAVFGTCK